MPQLEMVIKQIAELDPVEREELLLALAADYSPLVRPTGPQSQPYHSMEYPSIVATPGVCGGEPRVIRTRIPIWVLERMRQQGVSEVDILRSYPTLRAVDLVQAWSYAARYPREIERAIRENEED
jgi:uncharacterized protein (DUF433 family)